MPVQHHSGGVRSVEDRLKILIVDFGRHVTSPWAACLEKSFNLVQVASIGDLANRLRQGTYPVAILANGAYPDGKTNVAVDLQAAELIRQAQSSCQLLFLINQTLDLESCCQAVKLGAAGFIDISRDSLADELTERIEELFSRWREQRDQIRSFYQSGLLDQTGIATQSPNMLRLLAQARKAANVCDAPIIIEGETGTGKQLLAEAVHKMDPKRRHRPFISVNCAAITGTLAESALFGHRKGAFTGATEDRPGYFRAADGGTLMLDEISELEHFLQPKLLRVLQEGKVLPVGDDREYSIDVRVMAASNKPLAEQVVQDRFRLDLYQRLNVIKLRLPPLRERLEDIPLLVQYFLKKYGHYYREPIRQVEPAIYVILKRAVGQGNVRELENIIRQSLAFKNSGSILTVADLPEQVRQSATTDESRIMPAELAENIIHMLQTGPVDLGRLVERYERQILRTAISDLGLRGTRLSVHLNLNRRTLYHKLRKYDLLDPA